MGCSLVVTEGLFMGSEVNTDSGIWENVLLKTLLM